MRTWPLRDQAWRVGLVFWMTAACVWGQTAGDNAVIDDYNFAAWLYNQGKYDLAIEAYQKFLDAHAGHERTPDVRFGLAQALFQQGQYEAAARAYEQLRNDYKDFAQMPEVLFQLAQARVALNQFAQAEPIFAEVQTRFGDHYLADWALARQAACLISLQKFDQAETKLKTFLDRYAPPGGPAERAPATVEMFRRLDESGLKAREAFLTLIERSLFHLAITSFNQNRFDEAETAFARFLKDYPSSSLADEARFRIAQSFFRQERYAEAAKAYEPVAGEFGATAAFEQGLALHKAGKLKEAANQFAAMANRFPQDAKADTAKLYAGTFLYEAGDYKGAIARLRPLAEAGGPSADQAAYWMGMSLLKNGQAAEAEEVFSAALPKYPSSTMAGDLRLGLADARLAQNKFDVAAQTFGEYAEAYPQQPSAPRALYAACAALHRADRYADSDRQCEAFLKRYEKDALAADVLFLSAENRFLAKNYGAAAPRYAEVLKQENLPADRAARVHFRMAWIHRYAKRYPAALEELALVNAEAAGPTIAAESDYLRGACRFEAGQWEEAAAALTRYLDAPDSRRFGDDALLKLGVAQGKLDRKKDAARSLSRLVSDYPTSELAPQAQYQLAEFLYEQKDFSKALSHYRGLAERKVTDDLSAYARFGMGLCHFDQGQWDEAAQAFGDLVAAFPRSPLVPQALYRRGTSLMKRTRWAEAEKTFRDLLAAAPRHELARAAQAAIGTCAQEQKHWPEAAEAFKAVTDAYPPGKDMARMFYELAWSWREAGRTRESTDAFQQLANKFPDDPLAADAWFYLAEARYNDKPAEGAVESPKDQASRLAEARSGFEKVLAAPESKRLADKALYRIGWCDWLTGRYAESAASFDRLVTEFPASTLVPDALFQAAQSCAKDGQPAEAVKRYTRLVDDNAFSRFEYLPDAYVGLGDAFISLNQPEEAIRRLTTLTERFGSHRAVPEAFFLIGKAHYDLQQFDLALASFKQVTERTRSEAAAKAQFYTGQVLQAKEDFKGALVAYLRIPALYGPYREWVAAASFESGKCHEAQGDKESARKAYQDVVTTYSDTRWAAPAADRLKLL